MANQEQLDILEQSAQIWNRWRGEHSEILHPNLTGANLTGADLRYVNLRHANLRDANLRDADLPGADLWEANLSEANLRDADLTGANLSEANLRDTDLTGANLSEANLRDTDLTGANLSEANLREARVRWTSFGDVDLSMVKNLETVLHGGPSVIGIDTIYRSQGKIPEVFLKKAGVPDSFIDYMRSLVSSPFDYYSCFISYSSNDEAFAERLYADLQSKGVRCWFAPEDMDIGDKIRPRIEESIRLYDKLLLVLSVHSIASNWVAYEVERALNKEPQGKPNVLYPIRVDDTVMESKAGWADDIKSTRHIGDFTNWKNHDHYQKAFDRLLRALKAK